jgi:outer membrane protein
VSRCLPLALLFVPMIASAEEPRRLTLADAVQIASGGAKDVKIADEGVAAADARKSAARANLFPKLHADGNVFVWDQPLAFPAFPEPVRDQVTATLSLSVAQPITGLVTLLRVLEIEKSGHQAAEAERDRARLDAADRAAESFLRALQARAFVDIAAQSLTQVGAQLDRAKALERAGVLGAVDVLRLEAARAAAEQAALRAESGKAIADRALVLSLGIEDRSLVIEPVDDLPSPPPKVTVSTGGAKKASEARPEIAAAKERVYQAEAGRGVAISQFFPGVVGIATYQHSEGSVFQPADSAFVGATLSWDLFEWGKSLATLDEAEHRAEQARIAFEAVKEQIEFDAERRALDLETAYKTLSVAEVGLRASEEAHRIQSARFGQGEATTTDVLDAETELARARSSYSSARYDYYVAFAHFARAVGKLPTASPSEIGER